MSLEVAQVVKPYLGPEETGLFVYKALHLAQMHHFRETALVRDQPLRSQQAMRQARQINKTLVYLQSRPLALSLCQEDLSQHHLLEVSRHKASSFLTAHRPSSHEMFASLAGLSYGLTLPLKRDHLQGPLDFQLEKKLLMVLLSHQLDSTIAFHNLSIKSAGDGLLLLNGQLSTPDFDSLFSALSKKHGSLMHEFLVRMKACLRDDQRA